MHTVGCVLRFCGDGRGWEPGVWEQRLPMPLVEGYTQGGEACRTARRHSYNSGTPLLTGVDGLVRSCRCGVAEGYPTGPARDSTRHPLQGSTTPSDRGVRTGWQQQERPTGGRWVRETQGLGEWSAFQGRMHGSGRSSAGYLSAGQEGMQGTNWYPLLQERVHAATHPPLSTG